MLTVLPLPEDEEFDYQVEEAVAGVARRVGGRTIVLFTSQTKECLSSPPSSFGSTCKIPARVIKEVIGLGILDKAGGWSELWLGPKYTFIRNDNSGTLAAAGLQFQIQESFQGLGNAEILGARISQRLIQMVAHRR